MAPEPIQKYKSGGEKYECSLHYKMHNNFPIDYNEVIGFVKNHAQVLLKAGNSFYSSTCPQKPFAMHNILSQVIRITS